jgi:hypothetical protein
VVNRAEGNPLFATQLVRQLVVERALVRRGRRYSLARHLDIGGILPADIGAVWERRIALSGAKEDDLRALALVRERVSLEVADALGKLAGTGLADSIDRALAADLLQRDGELYAWAHGLLRDYLVRSVPQAEASRLHGWSAEALASLVGREDVQEERAMHLANAHRHREACDAMLDAALWSWRRAEREGRQRRAEVLRAWSAASGFPDLEARALAELGHIHADSGNFDEANEAIEGARAKLATETAHEATNAWVLFRTAQMLSLRGQAEAGAKAYLNATVAARVSRESEVEATSLLQLAVGAYRRGSNLEARRLFDDAASLARMARNRATEALALLQRSALEEPTQQDQLLRSAIEMARAAGALRIELMARQMWVDVLWRMGERERARIEASSVSNEAERRSLRQTVSILELQAACWAAEEDDWERLRLHRKRASAWGAEAGAVPERAFAAALDLVLAFADGDEPRAQEAIEKLQCEGRGYDEPTFRELITKAATLAPPHMSQQLARR